MRLSGRHAARLLLLQLALLAVVLLVYSMGDLQHVLARESSPHPSVRKVSQNVSIWVGNDTQSGILFPLSVLILGVNLTLQTSALALAFAEIPLPSL